MKILFVNPAPIIKYGIGKAFAEQGHEIFFVSLAAEKSLRPFLDDIKPQYVFTENGTGLFKKLFPLLEHREIPHIYWAIEDPVDFHQLSLPYARKSAWTFTPCKESIADYRKYRIEAYLLMFACLPSFHRYHSPENRYKHDIVFVGNNYARHPARLQGMNNILRPLMDREYDIKIYGNEWWLNPDYPFNIEAGYYGGYLPNEEFPILCSSAAINLGLHSVNTSTTMMSMRTFEVLGCGGFYLSQWTPAIERMFKNHYHLVWTKSEEETIDLVNYYLAHPEERKKIALRGQKEVYEKHTYHHRVEDMIKILKKPVVFPKKRASTSASIRISPAKKILLPHQPL
jgi:spore maturation protein CgeB